MKRLFSSSEILSQLYRAITNGVVPLQGQGARARVFGNELGIEVAGQRFSLVCRELPRVEEDD